MAMQAKGIFLLLGLGLFLWGVSLGNSAEGVWIISVGSLIVLCVYILQRIENMDAQGRRKRAVEKIKTIFCNKEMLEARELKRISSETKRGLPSEDSFSQDAKKNLGWGREPDPIDKDWWLKLPPIECGGCRKVFVLTEDDISRLRFPLKPDVKIGMYVEVACKECGRRKTVFRNC